MRRWWIIGAIVIGIAVGGGSGFYLWQKNVPGPRQEAVVPTPAPPALLTWKDPAGFSFQYPADVTVDPHAEDMENYAHVELTHASHPGKLIVWASDTTAADISAWVKTEKRLRGASIMDTTLGGEPATKAVTSDPDAMLITGTVFDELIFRVEATLSDREYWTGVHAAITDTFKFIPLEDEVSASGSSGDDV